MALILKDRVKETSSSSGTGSITLGGAFPGYQTFNAAIASGSTVYYTIHNLTAGSDGEWEVGLGTFTSTATLSRDTVLSSSTGSKVNFTAGANGLEVFITQPAEEAVYINQATGKVEAFGNGANTIAFTNINASNVVMVSGTISTNAANATDITNKTYVDNLFSTGITYHDPVLVESPTALTATYNQPGGAGNGVGATLTNSGANVALSIDGVSLSNTARVLIYTQANAAHNGVYTVTNPGNVSAQWVLTRATDADTYGVGDPNKLGQGDAFFVTSGNTGAGETYILNTVGTITFGTTNLTFAQISSAQVYSAGTGLNLANLTFSLVTPVATTNGGTGLTSFTANAIPYASNTSALVTGSALTFDGTNLSTTGQVISTKTGSATTGAGQVYLNGATSNRIDWAAVGTGAPAFTTRSDGTKLLLYPSISGSITDYAIGIDAATMWYSVPENNASFKFKWYGATTEIANLTGTGAFTATSFTGNGVALTAINASNVTSGTLDNARTTGNTANSASTIVLRDANGSFGANIITATFSGNGATLSAINASNISSGTIANARTTAASANGASTIVLRDAAGDFAADAITANFFIGDGSNVSAINGSNVTTGTIANARTTAATANGASTIVLRGASGEFAAGAITGTSFSGNGSALTAINATAITSGTLDNARTNATSANGASTLVVRDANGSFAGNVITGTTGTFTNISGNGTSLTAINASNVTSGTLDNARTTAASANGASTIVARDSSGNFTANAGTFTSVSGNGSALTAINASNVSTGTIANARTTAATANGASTIVLRGTSGEFAAGAITGASFTGDGAAISAINASNVSTGTIANARTTGASANGASTLVLRDANGSFAGNVGTFVLVSGAHSGNGAGLSDINASNISTGTISNARTTAASANGASTIVARDANGSFSANVISATTGSFTSVSGNGIGLTAINASNIASGTIANARTTGTDAATVATLVLRDANASFSGNVITGTTGTFTNLSGNGSSLTAINASNISSGTIANARTTAATANGVSTIVLRGTSGEFSAGAITGSSFTGDGSAISAINGSNVTTGTVANARTTAASANGASTIVARDANGSFAGNVVTATTGTFTSVSGNGVALTAINASNVTSGTLDNARTSAASANGASTIVSRDANGSFTANVVNVTTLSGGAVSGNGIGLTAINASNVSTGTIANARTTGTDAATASTIVLRDANASFSGNVITATNFSGGGGSISAINASNLASGTAPVARLAATGTPSASTFLRGDSSWSAVPSPNNGTLTMNTSGTGISGSATFTADQAGASTFTVASNANSANGASTIVLRGTSGEFSAGAITGASFTGSGSGLTSIPNSATTAASANGASTIVARDANGSFAGNVVTATTGTFTNLSGNGVALTAINASNISSGTVATARLASGTANATTYLRGDQTWATVSGGITLTNDTTTNASYYVTLTTATSGSISAANVSNTKLFFNPSTGTLTSTVHTSNSDERLKENWTDVTSDFVSKLAQVKHGVFSRKDSGNREPGVSAQSFMTVLPEAVVEGADGYLSVNYGGAALVAAIELAKVVERLQAEIAELRAELKAK